MRLADGREMINLCANNYLGLANHPAVLQAAHDALKRFGYGVASVRFICGTQSVHRELEERLSGYLGMEDTILVFVRASLRTAACSRRCSTAEDAVISDALNHASIIDGIRLCKARRMRYANNDMNELEQALKDSQSARVRMIATDGVFSMDGSIAKLREICDLASRYGALVMVDDSHATGFIGARGSRLSRTARRDGQGRHHDRHARKGPRRGERRLRGGAQGNRRLAAPAFAALFVLEQHCTPGRRRHLEGARPARGVRPSFASGCMQTPGTFGSRCSGWASICSPASTRSYRSCSARRRSRCVSPSACRPTASTSSRSRTRWFRRARRASALN